MCQNSTENKKMTPCDLHKTLLYTKNIKIRLLWHIPFFTLNKNTHSTGFRPSLHNQTHIYIQNQTLPTGKIHLKWLKRKLMNNLWHPNQPITELGTLQLCCDWLRTFIGQIRQILCASLMATCLCVRLYLSNKLLKVYDYEMRDEVITLSHPERPNLAAAFSTEHLKRHAQTSCAPGMRERLWLAGRSLLWAGLLLRKHGVEIQLANHREARSRSDRAQH